MFDKACVLIPAYCPTDKMIDYIDELCTKGIKSILIVNDGSNDEYNHVFETLNKNHVCHVIGYSQNKGKGYALKYGYNYILNKRNNNQYIVTADCDGQHTIDDVVNVIDALEKNPNDLILGVRDFSDNSVPFKSLFGNRFSSVIFYLLFHKYISDTQTGLRGFSSKYLPFMRNIKGDRYEYETNVLISCVEDNVAIKEIPISTVYEDNNSGTHFRPFVDSLKIMGTMFRGFMMFMGSSLICSFVDILFAFILLDFFKHIISSDLLRISTATIFARLISMFLNYSLNKRIVFNKGNKNNTLYKYILLCLLIMALSSIFVYLVSNLLYLDEKLAKVIGDSLLFLLSYKLQKEWVFKNEQDQKC